MNWRILCLKVADATVGAAACLVLGGLDFLLRRSDPPGAVPLPPHGILIIRPGGMGDMVLLLPIVQRLREQFPDACIDIVCEKRNLQVLALAGYEDRALVYDGNPVRFLYRLVRRKYDVVIDTEQFHNFSAVFASLSGAESRIGFKINPRRNLLYTHLVNYAMDRPEGEQFLSLLHPLGIRDEGYRLEGFLNDPAMPVGAPLESEPRMPDIPRPFAVVHAGASTVYKLWPESRFVEIALELRRRCGLSILFTGDGVRPGVSRRLEAAMTDAGGRGAVLDGVSLLELAKIVRMADLFVGGDSGLAHLATALGRPAVVLFGPTDHQKWGFENARRAIVRHELPCAPCFIFGYHKPCRSIACMRAIRSEEVMEACERVLSARHAS